MGTTFGLSMVMLVTILMVHGEATLVVPGKISPIFKHEHQGIESKNNKANLENVAYGKENKSLPSSAGSILKGSRCLNSNNATILEAKDSVSRKETLLDKNYSLEYAEAKPNSRLPSFAGEQPISIGSLSKLPSTWNSDGMKNGSIAT